MGSVVKDLWWKTALSIQNYKLRWPICILGLARILLFRLSRSRRSVPFSPYPFCSTGLLGTFTTRPTSGNLDQVEMTVNWALKSRKDDDETYTIPPCAQFSRKVAFRPVTGTFFGHLSTITVLY